MNSKDLFISDDKMTALLGCSCGEPEHGYIKHMVFDIEREDMLYVSAGLNTQGLTFKQKLKVAWAALTGQNISHDFLVNFESLQALGLWAEARAKERDELLARKYPPRSKPLTLPSSYDVSHLTAYGMDV